MRTGNFDGNYHLLTPTERFRLTVAADARGDMDEVRRLCSTCPRVTLSRREPAFTSRLEAARAIGTAVLAQLSEISNRIAELDAMSDFGKVMFRVAADEADYEAFRVDDAVQPKVRRVVLRAGGRFRKSVRLRREALRTEGATLSQALASFCKTRLEVDPSEFAAFIEPDLQELFESFSTQSADATAVELAERYLAEEWRRLTAYLSPAD